MTARMGTRRLAVAGLFAAALVLTGCGGEITGTAQPESGAGGLVPATGTSPTTGSPSSTTKRSPAASTTTKAPGHSGGDVEFSVEIGECVKLGGSITDAEIDHAACGSTEANYKVISKVANHTDCISDADSYYYETLNGTEQGALCLDIDWAVGTCMDTVSDDPKRVDCASPVSGAVKVIDILDGADSVDACPSDASGGYVYNERRIVVCTAEL